MRYANKVIPHFQDALMLSGATHLALGEIAGIAPSTIQKASNGLGISPHLAETLMEVVCTHDFPNRRASAWDSMRREP